MKKTIFLIVSILLIGITTKASKVLENEKKTAKIGLSTNISGSVVDSTTGESLVGVALYFEELNKTIYTDLEGNFEISNINVGEYNIKSNYISYQNNTLKNVNIDGINNVIRLILKKN